MPVQCIFVMMVLIWGGYGHAAEDPGTTAGAAEPGILQAGERIYRNGILPDGTPLTGIMNGGVPVQGAAVACANCHARSGLGRTDGRRVMVPAINAAIFGAMSSLLPIRHIPVRGALVGNMRAVRPSHTETSIARAVREGIGPVRRLLPAMPRFALSDGDMRVLTGYLNSLSASYSPGVTDTTMHLATIVTDDVSAEDRQAMLAPLETLVSINRQTDGQRQRQQFARLFRMPADRYFRHIDIHVWELRGPPGTWRDQLERYLSTQPVFALIGGISGKSWEPIHRFCEERGIPCLLPITDLPVISSGDWYTRYASRGFFQEGATAARYLLAGLAPQSGDTILQVVAGTEQGGALAAGFQSAWQGNPAALVTETLAADEPLDVNRLQLLLQKHRPATLILWAGGEASAALAALPDDTTLPQTVLISGRYLGPALTGIPDRLREATHITYPFRLPEDERRHERSADTLVLGKLKHKDERRIASRTFSMVHVFLAGLKEMKQNFYRDALLEAIGSMDDQYLPDYERYSFGPGQRYASRGCYVVQLTRGPGARLIKKSDWMIF